MKRIIRFPYRVFPLSRVQALALLCCFCVAIPLNETQAQAPAELADLEQKAIRQAADRVSEAVVQIRTIGGSSEIAGKLLNQGPTTGLIVSDEGYIVSSAANLAGKPTSIIVRTATGDQLPAELIGRDENRMLVLLKVDLKHGPQKLETVPVEEVLPGQWAIALGRVYDAEKPNLAVGVISAVGRMHGRAIQTDANVSSANYGGPLLDIRGRVYGILVPMAPQPASSEVDELAGVEFYDSGIGFAIPLSDVLTNLPRWIAEGDLKRGLLGIGMRSGSPHAQAPAITNVWPNSPAKKAGWQVGDTIVEVNGKSVQTQTQLRFQVTPRYAGDILSVKIQRGAEKLDTEVTLTDELEPLRHAFLGVLPERQTTPPVQDEKEQSKASLEGVKVRAVWPDSPAQAAGIVAEDRIVKLGERKIRSIADAVRELDSHHPGDKLVVEFRRDEKLEQQETTLSKLPNDLHGSVDLPTRVKAVEQQKLVEKAIKVAEFPQEATYYRAENALPRGSLLLWLESSEASNESLAQRWKAICLRDNLTLVIARPADSKGWSRSDLAYLKRLLGELRRVIRPDMRRVVVAGAGKSGQLAYRVALANRGMVAGVAPVTAPLPRTIKIPANQPSERLAILVVQQQNSPLAALTRQNLEQLTEAGYPASELIFEATGGQKQTLDAEGREKLARWIDTLDRF
ncbi:MAG: PDZ domain-containing protein [Lacipirellulaceae bacterium]